MEQELVKVENNQIVLSEQAKRELKKLQEFQVTIQEMKNEEEEIKEAIRGAMEKTGVIKFENEDVTISYVKGSERTTFNRKKFAEDHPKLCKEYIKTSFSSPYIKIEYKED